MKEAMLDFKSFFSWVIAVIFSALTGMLLFLPEIIIIVGIWLLFEFIGGLL